MVRYLLSRIGVTITLNTLNPEELVAAEVRPVSDDIPEELVTHAIELLQSSYGIYGHRITGKLSAIDLASAMASSEMQEHRPILQEGADIIASYKPSHDKNIFT